MIRPWSFCSLLTRIAVRSFSNGDIGVAQQGRGLFKQALDGDFTIKNSDDAKLFLNATLNRQDTSVGCVERILKSRHGIRCFQDAFNIDKSPRYMNSTLRPVLSWLQHPQLQGAGNGVYLRRILHALVDRSPFWEAFVYNHKTELINAKSMQCFGWLLLQLLTLTPKIHPAYITVAEDPVVRLVFKNSTDPSVVRLGERIERISNFHKFGNTLSSTVSSQPCHDNDFKDIKDISIFPILNEALSDGHPRFLRPSEVEEEEESHDRKVHKYISNLFRLYREDLLLEAKEDIRIALGNQRSLRQPIRITGLKPYGTSCLDASKNFHHPWTLMLKRIDELSELKNLNQEAREAYIDEHPKFIPDQSLGILIADGDPVAIVKTWRDEGLLSQSIICAHIPSRNDANRVLPRLSDTAELEIVLFTTAGYAHEPVLGKLQNLALVPFEEEIIFWDSSKCTLNSEVMNTRGIKDLISQLQRRPEQDLKREMKLKTSVSLDRSQAKCLVSSLRQRLSLVQGPPGTGKSFIGALAAKALYDHTNETILVVCYTNQALDQFIQDIRKIGIPDSQIVRLGALKRTDAANRSLLLSELRHRSGSRSNGAGFRMQILENAYREADMLYLLFHELHRNSLSLDAILHYLKNRLKSRNSTEVAHFHQAFEIFPGFDRRNRVNDDPEPADPLYLIRRWASGEDPGLYPEKHEFPLWGLPLAERKNLLFQWKATIHHDRVLAFLETAERHKELLDQAHDLTGQADEQIIMSKRIIACTTTGAAKYSQVRNAAPGIMIVEEAGEILESHVIAALSPSVKQLIMIGDHKQLPPKVHRELDTHKRWNLDQSLFERLVHKGYPHSVLAQQHRMRPEISSLAKQLFYPDLIDAPSTQNRPALRGFSDNVIFVNHDHPEDEAKNKFDAASLNTSKRNSFEAEMVSGCVKYVIQQDYDASAIVVLTPYLGQLFHLRKVLGKDFRTVLNERSKAELARTGVDFEDDEIFERSTKTEMGRQQKPRIQVSTIDNYQGQESDIVVASLTRSNHDGEIGFLSDPGRVNVLLTRARNGLIMIGNTSTFKNARKGRDVWTKFLGLLEDKKHVFQGFPVKCENHPENTALLKTPKDFETHCPEGGCTERCETILSCGIHKCPSKCHHQHDHSFIKCQALIFEKCARGRHTRKFKCHESSDERFKSCNQCQLDDIRKKELIEKRKARSERAAARLKKEDATQEDMSIRQRKEKNSTGIEEGWLDLTLETNKAEDEEIKEPSKKAKKRKKKKIDARKAEEVDRKTYAPGYYNLTFPGLEDADKGGKDGSG